jgi:hypothetical protein
MREHFKATFAIMLIGVTALIGSTQLARAVVEGQVGAMFADPSDFVFALDKQGPCVGPGGSKSNFFHIKRASINFKEVVAVVMTAFSLGKTVAAFDVGCEGNRNIIDHVGVIR